MNNYQKLAIEYKDTVLGNLEFDGKEYRFIYTEEFQKLKIQPLPGIEPPESKSSVLWAYFQSRLPNPRSPLYKRLLSQYALSNDTDDLMLLLGTIGSRVATDPFIIVPSKSEIV